LVAENSAYEFRTLLQILVWRGSLKPLLPNPVIRLGQSTKKAQDKLTSISLHPSREIHQHVLNPWPCFVSPVRKMKWVTREHVHVDRTACPWLIKKYVDPKAEFIFVPVEKVEEVAKKEKAIPYDTPNAELGHHGDKCSFDAIAEKYNIKDPALLQLAKIIRSADTGKPLAPEGVGLDAVMTGISVAAKDDHEAVEKAGPVYDALYMFCRLKLLAEKYKREIKSLDRKQRREFLRKKLLEQS